MAAILEMAAILQIYGLKLGMGQYCPLVLILGTRWQATYSKLSTWSAFNILHSDLVYTPHSYQTLFLLTRSMLLWSYLCAKHLQLNVRKWTSPGVCSLSFFNWKTVVGKYSHRYSVSVSTWRVSTRTHTPFQKYRIIPSIVKIIQVRPADLQTVLTA